jgi:hypothetical protein
VTTPRDQNTGVFRDVDSGFGDSDINNNTSRRAVTTNHGKINAAVLRNSGDDLSTEPAGPRVPFMTMPS